MRDVRPENNQQGAVHGATSLHELQIIEVEGAHLHH